MKLEQSFEVAAPVDRVWKTLIDLEQVAPCLPGAAITGHDEDGTYHGTFQVKLGPTTASYRGTIRIQDADEASHTATLAAKGSDKRGQGVRVRWRLICAAVVHAASVSRSAWRVVVRGRPQGARTRGSEAV